MVALIGETTSVGLLFPWQPLEEICPNNLLPPQSMFLAQHERGCDPYKKEGKKEEALTKMLLMRGVGGLVLDTQTMDKQRCSKLIAHNCITSHSMDLAVFSSGIL